MCSAVLPPVSSLFVSPGQRLLLPCCTCANAGGSAVVTDPYLLELDRRDLLVHVHAASVACLVAGLASKSPQNTRFLTRIVTIVWALPPVFNAMKVLNGEGGESGEQFHLSSLVCAFVPAFPMKCASIVFKSLSDKTLGAYFPQTELQWGQLTEASCGFQDSLNLPNGRKCCLTWAALRKALQGEKSKFFGSDLNLLTGLQLLRRMTPRKSSGSCDLLPTQTWLWYKPWRPPWCSAPS